MISGSVYFGLALTCGAYVVGCVVHRFAKTPLLNPLMRRSFFTSRDSRLGLPT